MATMLPIPQAFLDDAGLPVQGGKVYTYDSGTTNPRTSYSDLAGTIPNANPLTLDAAGRANIFGTGFFTLKVYKADGVTLVRTIDGVGITDVTAAIATNSAALASSANGSGADLVGGVGRVVSTIAALRALLKTGVGKAYVLGYYAAGDGGGGQYYYDSTDTTSADNGGTVIVASDGGRWKLAVISEVSITQFGAKNDGSASISTAWQAAVDYCRDSATCKTIVFPPGNYLHTVALNMTTSARKSIAFVGLGSRKGAKILCGTGGWAVDLTGSAWTAWKGLYFIHASSNPSYGVFLLGGTATDTECLYHNFDNDMIELYNTGAPALFGTIGFAVIGSEENTFHACNVFANSPYVFSTSYSTISASYPSPYQTIQASHSCGVNTFSGENVAVTYDKKFANVAMFGANMLHLGNMYFGNVNIGAPGTSENCIRVLGGTIEGLFGTCKVENRSTLFQYDGGELYDVRLKFAVGAGISPSVPAINFGTPGALGATNKVDGFDCDVSYFSPSDASFAGKQLLAGAGVSGGTGIQIPQLANIRIRSNQLSTLGGIPAFPAQFCGVGVNCVLEYPDFKYTLYPNKHVKQLVGQVNLGLGNSVTGATVATITLPAITGGFSARGIGLRLRGLVSSINEGAGASDTNITLCPVDTSKSAYSDNTGAIVVGAAGASSDAYLNTTSIALSTASANFLFTGVTLNLTYNAGPRTITVTAIPKGTGASLASVLTFLSDIELEMLTVGRVQELIYIQ